MRLIKIIIVFVLFTGLTTGCSSTGSDSGWIKVGKDKSTKPNSKLEFASNAYESANEAMQKGNFQTALLEYSNLILLYPFGAVTEQAKLDRIFVYDQVQDSESAVKEADRFISQYPTHAKADYAYYMKGIALFAKKANFLEKRSKVNRSKNKRSLIKSKTAFEDLIQRFPASEYVGDAKQRIIYLTNEIAQQELNIAEFYAGRNAHIAAINRAKYVIDNYSKTPAAYKSLILMRDTYKEMGLIDAARDTQAVIDLNAASFSETTANLDIDGTGVKAKKKKSLWSMPKLFKKKDKKIMENSG